MTTVPMPPEQSAAAVVARLGRPPTDAIEAAVVLEAWRGLDPGSALAHGRGAAASAVHHQRLAPPPHAPAVPAPLAGQALGLLVVLTGVLIWAGPLGTWVGTPAFSTGWRTALPLVLATQWFTQARFATGQRSAQLGVQRRALTAVGTVVLAGLVLLNEGPTLITLVLMLPWLGLLLFIEHPASRRSFLLLTVAVAPLLHAGLPPRHVLVAYSVLVLVLLDRTAAGAPAPTLRTNPLPMSLLAGAIGLGLGVLLVVGVPAPRNGSPWVVVLMFPSIVGGLWASRRLNALWVEIPASLRSVPLDRTCPVPRGASRLVTGALCRYLAATGVATVVVLVVADGTGDGPWLIAAAYASFGLAGILTSLAWSVGGHLIAAVSVTVAVVTTATVSNVVAGAGALLIGSLTMTVVLTMPVIAMLAGMERVFATRMQIP